MSDSNKNNGSLSVFYGPGTVPNTLHISFAKLFVRSLPSTFQYVWRTSQFEISKHGPDVNTWTLSGGYMDVHYSILYNFLHGWNLSLKKHVLKNRLLWQDWLLILNPSEGMHRFPRIVLFSHQSSIKMFTVTL